MKIIKFNTEEEKEQIIIDMEAQGYALTNISNLIEGDFLGFMSSPIPIKTNLEEQIEYLQNTADLILLKQEGII